MSKNIAVFGLYSTRTGLEAGIDGLRATGFRATDVSVLLPENLGNKDLAYEKSSKAPEGAATGALSGAIVGGALGWLAGIGALAIPGLGPFIAAGPIMAALAGVGAGGAVGGVGGALAGLGIPEYEAVRYVGRVHGGSFLLSVHCDNGDWRSRAETVLKNSGAEDISSTSEARADFAATDKPIARTTSLGV
ncbi:MAG: DUF3341 domain-containing protein [Acidobacteriota bacterium]